MQTNDPYQTPSADHTNNVEEDPTVKLWLPQASMMAEQGKTAMSIQLFFKSKLSHEL